ncbi:MAG: hypothetical protein ACR2HX_08865 [Pyrinomonadaceae bacterium]
MNRFVAFLFGLTLILISPPVWAQQIEPSKLEIGAQFSSLTLTEPGIKREVGVGGRLTYNVNRSLAIEAEGNYFPSGSTRGFIHGGNILQGQFGVKAGKRWDRFGIFAKARPGFLKR